MANFLLLGNARSGITPVARAIVTAADLPVEDVRSWLGLWGTIQEAIKIYQDKEVPLGSLDIAGVATTASTEAGRLAAIVTQAGRFGAPGAETALLCAPDLQPDCPYLTAAAHALRANSLLKAIVVSRPGVEFINSRLRVSPGSSFVDHCSAWARGMAALRGLKEEFGDRILDIDQIDLLKTPEIAGERLRTFMEPAQFNTKAFTRTIKNRMLRRTKAQLDASSLQPSKASWSMAEVGVFELICGRESALMGRPVDLQVAERLRPVDLAQLLVDRADSVGGLTIVPSEEKNGGPLLRREAGSQGVAELTLSPINAGKRRKIRLRAQVNGDPIDSFLLISLTDSLSRRALFVQQTNQNDSGNIEIEANLPAHGGLIDLRISHYGEDLEENSFEVKLHEAVVSHA